MTRSGARDSRQNGRPDSRGTVVRLGLALVSILLIGWIHAAFWSDQGLNRLVTHGPNPDQFLTQGELRLSLLHVMFGFPAALLMYTAWRPCRETLQAPNAPQTRLLPLAFAILTSLGAFLIAHFVHDYAWFTDDEQAYLYQAKLYSDGLLTGPALQPAAALQHLFVVTVPGSDGARWAGVYPLLQPWLISVSKQLGNSHLIQFLTAGLLTYNTARFAQELLQKPAAGAIVGGLCASSPMLIGLGSTLHTSVLAAMLTVLTARAFLLAMKYDHNTWSSSLLGLLIGATVLTRPMEGALLLLFLALSVAARLFKTRHLSPALTSIAGYVLGGLLPLLVFLWSNEQMTGHLLSGPYDILEHRLGRFFGFGDHMMFDRSHGIMEGLGQTASALLRLNNWAFGWPLAIPLVLLALFRPLRNRKCSILLAISALHLSAYFPLAFGSVHDFGSAYHLWHVPWLATVGAWVLLKGCELLRGRLAFYPFYWAAAMSLVGLAAFWPMQLARWQTVGDIVRSPVRLAEQTVGDSRAVILYSRIEASIFKARGEGKKTWVYQAPAPYPSDPILWAKDFPALRPALRAAFPDRKFFRLVWSGQSPLIVPAE